MRRIRKGDEVMINAGKDRGRTGTVLRVLDGDRILVEGVNVVKRHTKGNPQRGISGGIIEKEMPIHRSNVMLYDVQANKGTRVGIRALEDGRKVRFYKTSGEVIDT